MGYGITMKRINDEQEKSVISGEGVGGVDGSDKGGGAERRVQSGSEAVVAVGVGGAPAKPVKPKGSSITFRGSGKRDGSDINNSMGLA